MKIAFRLILVIAAMLLLLTAWDARLEILQSLLRPDALSVANLRPWHDQLLSIVAADATLFGVTIAVLGFSQRTVTRPFVTAAEGALIVAQTTYYLRVAVATFANLLAGITFAALGLVPTIDADIYALFTTVLLACELILVALYILTGNDLRIAADKLKGALLEEEARYVKVEVKALVELLLPYLRSKYSVADLSDLANEFPTVDVPAKPRA